MDNERFLAACQAAASRQRDGIGTFGEKGIHNALKRYYEPDLGCHEVPVGGYVADIVGGHGVIEIQTAGFDRMREKLERFLEVTAVTIVWPCVIKKRIIKLDGETGEILGSRVSPKKGNHYRLLSELWGIRDLLRHDRLSIIITMMDADEYIRGERVRSRRRPKGGANGIERLPTALHGELRLDSPADYYIFIPDELAGEFTSQEYAKLVKLTPYEARTALNVLTSIGVAERCGKKGRAFLFRVC